VGTAAFGCPGFTVMGVILTGGFAANGVILTVAVLQAEGRI
jgi:hypothetical protein